MKSVKRNGMILAMSVLILLFSTIGVFAETPEAEAIGVQYRGHVQNKGDMPQPAGTMVKGPDALGTRGESLRVEGFWIKLTGDVPEGASIKYQVHVQNEGWMTPEVNGEFAGTHGKSQRVESIRINLENLPGYDVYYRGHVQNVGDVPQVNGDWGWKKNGEELGTTGSSLRLEELQVKVVKQSDVTYDKAGTYGPKTGEEVVHNNVVINTPDVTLQNMHITGDLTIGEGVGEGDVTLNNITVDGDTFIRGGGKNSIHINGGDYNKITVQQTSSGQVRIVATDATGLEVVISEDAGGEDIILEGAFENVQVDAPDVKISTQGDTKIGEFKLAEGATGTQLTLDSKTTVDKLVLDAKADVKGQGTVKEAEVNKDGVTFEKAPDKQDVSPEVETPPVVTPPEEKPPATPPADPPVTPPTTTLTNTTIVGDNNIGSILTAETTPTNATGTYVWSRSTTRDGTYTNITDATAKTYQLQQADVGHYIKVSVIGNGTYAGTKMDITDEVITNLKEITANTALTAITLNTDEHLVNLAELIKSGKLPTTVTVTDGTTPVHANITEWKETFDGTATGTKNLTAVWQIPNGYIDRDLLPAIRLAINVTTVQTPTALIPSSAKEIINTTIGQLNDAGNLIEIPINTKVSALIAALTVSKYATVDILADPKDGIGVIGDTTNVNVTNAMKVRVTAQDTSKKEYSIQLVENNLVDLPIGPDMTNVNLDVLVQYDAPVNMTGIAAFTLSFSQDEGHTWENEQVIPVDNHFVGNKIETYMSIIAAKEPKHETVYNRMKITSVAKDGYDSSEYVTEIDFTIYHIPDPLFILAGRNINNDIEITMPELQDGHDHDQNYVYQIIDASGKIINTNVISSTDNTKWLNDHTLILDNTIAPTNDVTIKLCRSTYSRDGGVTTSSMQTNGVAISPYTSNAKQIVATNIGVLNITGNIQDIPKNTKVSDFIAGLTISNQATVDILTGPGGETVTDRENTDVTDDMIIHVTALNGSTRDYTATICKDPMVASITNPRFITYFGDALFNFTPPENNTGIKAYSISFSPNGGEIWENERIICANENNPNIDIALLMSDLINDQTGIFHYNRVKVVACADLGYRSSESITTIDFTLQKGDDPIDITVAPNAEGDIEVTLPENRTNDQTYLYHIKNSRNEPVASGHIIPTDEVSWKDNKTFVILKEYLPGGDLFICVNKVTDGSQSGVNLTNDQIPILISMVKSDEREILSTNIGILDQYGNISGIPTGTTVSQLLDALTLSLRAYAEVLPNLQGEAITDINTEITGDMVLRVYSEAGSGVIHTLAMAPVLSGAKAITSTTVGILNSGNITLVPTGTKISALKAGLTVSDQATVEIVTGAGGTAVTDQASTDVTADMKIKVTAENGTSIEYTIAMAQVSISTTPTTGTAVVAKTTQIQASVNFTLTSVHLVGAWKVFTNAVCTTEASGVTASLSGNTLTLTHATDLPAATYYVVYNDGTNSNSDALALTVSAYEVNLVDVVKNARFEVLNGTSILYFDQPTDKTGIQNYQIMFSSDNGQTWDYTAQPAITNETTISLDMSSVAINLNETKAFNKVKVISGVAENSGIGQNEASFAIDFKLTKAGSELAIAVARNELNNVEITLPQNATDDEIYAVRIFGSSGVGPSSTVTFKGSQITDNIITMFHTTQPISGISEGAIFKVCKINNCTTTGLSVTPMQATGVTINPCIVEWADTAFTTIPANNDNPPYQLMQINYKRNEAVTSSQMTISMKTPADGDVAADSILWKSAGGTSQADSAFWQWSYRDASSVFDGNGTLDTTTQEDLDSIERSNDHQLKAGSVVTVRIDVVKDAKTYSITRDYTITADDVTNSTYNSTPPILSSEKAITATTVGTLTGGNITALPVGTKVGNFKASLMVSKFATVEIITGTGGQAVANPFNTDVTADMIIQVTAQDGSKAEYTITMAPTLDAPANLVAEVGSALIRLTWDAAPNAQSYTIYQSTTSGSDYIEIASGVSSTACQAVNLQPGQTYYFVVKAVAAGYDDSVVSSEATAIANIDLSGNSYSGNKLVVTNESLSLATQSTGTLSNVTIDTQIIDGLDKGAYRINPEIPVTQSPGEPLVNSSMESNMTLANVNDERSFYTHNYQTQQYETITARCAYVGSHSEIWVDKNESVGTTLTAEEAQILATEFDQNIYDLITTNFYAAPDVNNDSKVAILVFDIKDGYAGSGGYVGGYFNGNDLYDGANSNQLDMIYVDTYPLIGTGKNLANSYSTMAHEFQHMVNFNCNKDQSGQMETWLNEALSLAAEHLYEGVQSSRISYYNNSTAIADGRSVMDWNNSDSLPNYALSYLFSQYLRTQTEANLGEGLQTDIYKQIIADPSDANTALANAIKANIDSDMTIEKFMTNFRVAMVLKADSGSYSFGKDAGLFSDITTKLSTQTSADLKGGGAIVKGISGSFTVLDVHGDTITFTGVY